MREFYLRSMDPNESVKITSAPKQIYRGGGAYNTQPPGPWPNQMKITSITDLT